MEYEEAKILDDALTHVPVERLHTEAEEQYGSLTGVKISDGGDPKPKWRHQDCVIRSLMRYVTSHAALIAIPLYQRWGGNSGANNKE